MISSKSIRRGAAFALLACAAPGALAQTVLSPQGAPPREHHGTSVDQDGDLLAVGAPGEGGYRGAVYVYVRSESAWTLSQKLLGKASGDRFGQSVALDGDFLAVGAPENDALGSAAGRVHLYRRSGAAFELEQEVVALHTSAGDRLGTAVALRNAMLLAGAPGEDLGANDGGAVHAFHRDASGNWVQDQTIVPAGVATGDGIGKAVAFNGQLAVIGAPGDDDLGSSSGSAFVFVRSGIFYSQQAKLLAADGAAVDLFGTSVAIDALNRVLVGSPNDDDRGSNSGSAYVFANAGSGWQQEAKIAPAELSAFDNFGSSVRIAGQHCLVGAAGGEAAYAFERSGSSWLLRARIVDPDADAQSRFGSAVDTDGASWVVGALDASHAGTQSGRTHVFSGPASAPALQASLSGTNGDAGEKFGDAVAVEGALVAVGSRLDSDAGSQSGAVYVLEEGAGGWSEHKLVPDGLGTADQFGGSVALDGGELLAGSSSYISGQYRTGGAWLFGRGAAGWYTAWVFVPADGSAWMGFGRALDKDGERIVIGAPGDDEKATDAGAVYVFERSGSSWSLAQKVLAPVASAGLSFGISVELEGNRMLVGASGFHGTLAGRAWIYERGASGWAPAAELVPSESSTGDWYGSTVALEGELALVGAHRAAGNAGRAFAFRRNGGDWSQEARLSDLEKDVDGFGVSVALEGGRALVGLFQADHAGPSAGELQLFEHAAGAWVRTASLHPSGFAQGEQLGSSVAIEGGRLVGGAPGAGAGKVYVYDAPPRPDVVPFCFGNGTGPACGCGNLGANGRGCANSVGNGSILQASGSTSLSAGSLAMTASAMPPHQSAILVRGAHAHAAGFGIPFRDGLLCTAGFLVRLGIVHADGTGRASWDFGTITPGVAAGATFPHQAWYRDPAGPCGTGSNLSNALLVRFAP